MAKNVERLQAREAKELIRREKQLGARSNKFYFISGNTAYYFLSSPCGQIRA